MCDLHRVQLTTLDARCSGGRPLPRCRAVVAGGRGRWQCTRGRGARTRASSTGVVGQAAGKLPYATTLWLLDAVARHATAASSDFLRSRSGGAPTGASTGKSRDARILHWPELDAYVWNSSQGAWWDGYQGQKKIILEEFRGQMTFGDLLLLLDRYAMRVQIKGGHAQIQAERIVICAPQHPASWGSRSPEPLDWLRQPAQRAPHDQC
jgi:hypothetical protein